MRRHWWRLAVGALGAVGLMVTTRAAHAEGMPQVVHAELPTCDPEPFPSDDLLEALRLELRQAGVTVVRLGLPPELDAMDGALVIRFSCDPVDTYAEITLRTRGGRSAVRVLDLSDLPAELRARGIALAVAEFLPTAWLSRDAPSEELSLAEVGAVEPTSVKGFPLAEDVTLEDTVEPPPTAEPANGNDQRQDVAAPSPGEPDDVELLAEPPKQAPRGSVEWGATLMGRGFLSPWTGMWGVRPTIAGRRVEFGVDALFGWRKEGVGRLDSRILAASLAYRIVERRSRAGRFWIAPRLSLGTLRVRSIAFTDLGGVALVRRPYLDLALAASAMAVLGRCSANVEVEGGLARGLVATLEGRIVAAFGGGFVGLGVGLRCGGRRTPAPNPEAEAVDEHRPRR